MALARDRKHVYLICKISFLGNRISEKRKRSQSFRDPRPNHDEINYSDIQSCFIPFCSLRVSDSFLSSNRNENINVSHASLSSELYDELIDFIQIDFITVFTISAWSLKQFYISRLSLVRVNWYFLCCSVSPVAWRPRVSVSMWLTKKVSPS